MPKSDMMIERKQKYELRLKWLFCALPLLPTSKNASPPNAAKRKRLHNYYSFFVFSFHCLLSAEPIASHARSDLMPAS